MIAKLGLSEIAAKYPGVEDVYVLEVCKTLDIAPEDVTQEQRRLAKALMYGRIYSMPASHLAAIEKTMKEHQF